MTTVVNVRGKKPTDFADDPLFVYVGRSVRWTDWKGSVFGNPCTTAEAFASALNVAILNPHFGSVVFGEIARRLPELLGKKLGCWCAHWPDSTTSFLEEPPPICHAIVLAQTVDFIHNAKANGDRRFDHICFPGDAA